MLSVELAAFVQAPGPAMPVAVLVLVMVPLLVVVPLLTLMGEATVRVAVEATDLLLVIVSVPVSLIEPVPSIVAPTPVRLIGPVPAIVPFTVRLFDSVSEVPLCVV